MDFKIIACLICLSIQTGCGSAQPSITSREGSSKSGVTAGKVGTSTATNRSTKTQNQQRRSPTDDKPTEEEPSTPPPETDALGESDGALPTEATPSNSDNSADAKATQCLEAPSAWVCDVELEIAALVAIERQNNSVTPLTFDAKLSHTARQWSAEQASRRSISHEWFQTGKLKSIHQQRFGEDPRLAAENVALVPCSGDAKSTAQALMSAWMNSSGHRANILRNGPTRLGVGIASANNYCFGTQDFGF